MTADTIDVEEVQTTTEGIQAVLDKAHEEGILEEAASAEEAIAAGVIGASINERNGERVLIQTVAGATPAKKGKRGKQLGDMSAAQAIEAEAEQLDDTSKLTAARHLVVRAAEMLRELHPPQPAGHPTGEVELAIKQLDEAAERLARAGARKL